MLKYSTSEVIASFHWMFFLYYKELVLSLNVLWSLWREICCYVRV